MKNLKISTRLSGAFALLVLMLVGLAVAAMAQLSSMRAATVEITEDWLPSIGAVNAFNTETVALRSIVLSHIMNTDDAAKAKIDQRLIAGREKQVQLRKKFEALISSPEEKKLYDEFASNWTKYIAVNDTALAHSRKNESDQARAIMEGESAKLFAISKEILDKLVKLNADGAAQSKNDADTTYTTARNMLLITAALAIALAIAAAVVLLQGAFSCFYTIILIIIYRNFYQRIRLQTIQIVFITCLCQQQCIICPLLSTKLLWMRNLLQQQQCTVRIYIHIPLYLIKNIGYVLLYART